MSHLFAPKDYYAIKKPLSLPSRFLNITFNFHCNISENNQEKEWGNQQQHIERCFQVETQKLSSMFPNAYFVSFA